MAQTKEKTTAVAEKEQDNNPLLTLSTSLKPCSTVDIDGTHYQILNSEHLGRSEEAKVLALFREHDRWQLRLARAKNTVEGEKAGGQMVDARTAIIATLTSIPRKLIESLGMGPQAQLLDICAKEMGFGDNRLSAEEGEGDYDGGDD